MKQSNQDDPYLQNRYGLRARRYPKWLITAVISALAGGGWLIWSAQHYSNPEIRSTLISFREIDEKSIEIRYSIEIKDPTKSASCRLSARDYGLNIVGQIDEKIPAGLGKTTRVILIPTRLAAVNAGIESCALL